MKELRKGQKRQDDVKIWERRIDLADRASEDKVKEFERNVAFYIGYQLGDADWSDDYAFSDMETYARSGKVLIVNRILAALAAQNASIMWRQPWHFLRTRRAFGPNHEDQRLSAEATLNFVLQAPKNNWLLNSRLMVLTAEMGMGWLKATYMPDEGMDKFEGLEEELGEIIVRVNPQTGEPVPSFMGGPPKLDDRGAPIVKRGNRYVIENRNPAEQYKTEWLHYADMGVDPEGGNAFTDHAFVTQRMSWRFSEFMENDMFEHKDEIAEVARFVDTTDISTRARKHMRGIKDGTGPQQMFDPTEADKDLMRIWGHQCWDPIKRKVIYLVDGFDKVVSKNDYPKYIDFSPYSVAKIHENPGDFYPVSEVTQSRPLAMAYNQMQSMLLTHMKRFTRWYLAKDGMFDTRQMNTVKDGDDGRIAFYKANFHASEFSAVQDTPLDPGIYAMMQRYITDMSEIMGSSPEARSTAGSDTATEAAIVETRTTARDNDKRQVVAKALENHAKITLDMIQDTLDTNLMVSVMGPDGTPMEQFASRATIQGDFSTWIDLTDIEPHDDMTERRDMNEILQILGPMAFAAPSFSKRFWQARRQFDPHMAKELQEIGEALLQMQMQQAQGQQESEGGANEVKANGKEQGRTTEGRSQGRKLRTAAGGS